MNRSVPVSYEDVACEYYDPVRHPTCANFREASRILLTRWLGQFPVGSDWLCDVGAGKSLMAELLTSAGSGLDRLLLIDESRSMLSYSHAWTTAGARVALADARSLPLRSETLGCLVSSLGDPYNDPLFWDEAYRVLRAGGIVHFTTPSYDWAFAYRTLTGTSMSTAVFELSDGRQICLPSLIYPEDEQRELMASSGFLTKEIAQIHLCDLESAVVSPKLLRERRGPHATLVTGYLLMKPGRSLC